MIFPGTANKWHIVTYVYPVLIYLSTECNVTAATFLSLCIGICQDNHMEICTKHRNEICMKLQMLSFCNLFHLSITGKKAGDNNSHCVCIQRLTSTLIHCMKAAHKEWCKNHMCLSYTIKTLFQNCLIPTVTMPWCSIGTHLLTYIQHMLEWALRVPKLNVCYNILCEIVAV